MRRKELLRREVQKWERILNGEAEDKGSKNCSLCLEADYCDGCPVYEKTGQLGCDGTPYEEWLSHQEEEHHNDAPPTEIPLKIECGRCRAIARMEITFLKGLDE